MRYTGRVLVLIFLVASSTGCGSNENPGPSEDAGLIDIGNTGDANGDGGNTVKDGGEDGGTTQDSGVIELELKLGDTKEFAGLCDGQVDLKLDWLSAAHAGGYMNNLSETLGVVVEMQIIDPDPKTTRPYDRACKTTDTYFSVDADPARDIDTKVHMCNWDDMGDPNCKIYALPIPASCVLCQKLRTHLVQ